MRGFMEIRYNAQAAHRISNRIKTFMLNTPFFYIEFKHTIMIFVKSIAVVRIKNFCLIFGQNETISQKSIKFSVNYCTF